MNEPAYCSYIMGCCVLHYGSTECLKRNPVECCNCRQKNEEANANEKTA